MLDDIAMPVKQTAKTVKGCEGKSSVPAITNGVLGSSEKPRRADIIR